MDHHVTLPIDVDDPATWPHNVVEIVGRWAGECRGTTEFTNDLPLPLEDEDRFRDLLSGRLLRAYHCTRLLPHEVDSIRQVGLRPLSPALIFDRVDAARAAGAISAAEAENLHAAHVFATGEEGYRRGKVCLILSKLVFRYNPRACEPLLRTWGGEVMYMSSGALPLRERLQGLGKPTIVIAHLDLACGQPRHMVFPALHKLFVGAALGLADVVADVVYLSPVPPDKIESVLQPGDPDYDALGDLPR